MESGRPTAEPSRPRGPRLYHKKSRKGCIRCKQRRVKCDEARPSCTGCSRHLVECVYPGESLKAEPSTPNTSSRPSASSTTSPTQPSNPATAPSSDVASSWGHGSDPSPREDHSPAVPGQGTGIQSPSDQQMSPSSSEDFGMSDFQLPESRERRMLELRLLHNLQSEMRNPFPAQQGPAVSRLWHDEVPYMAIKEGGPLLDILFAHSALHIAIHTQNRSEQHEFLQYRLQYQMLCSQGLRIMAGELTRQNADYVCMTSLRFLGHAMAQVQATSIDPWEPPTQWLHLGRGANGIFRRALQFLDPQDKFWTFLTTLPVLLEEAETTAFDRTQLLWLLDHPAGPESIEAREDQELEDPETRDAYEQALSYTCSVRAAVERNEPVFAMIRRLGGFSCKVPKLFAELCEVKRPRALVILAHFFALWIHYRQVWFVGNVGERQVRGIHKNLPMLWSSKLDVLFSQFAQKPTVPGPAPAGSTTTPRSAPAASPPTTMAANRSHVPEGIPNRTGPSVNMWLV